MRKVSHFESDQQQIRTESRVELENVLEKTASQRECDVLRETESGCNSDSALVAHADCRAQRAHSGALQEKTQE